jgi:hypothetical protein
MLFASHSSSFDRAFRAAFGHGQRLRSAHELGNYVMGGHNENDGEARREREGEAAV